MLLLTIKVDIFENFQWWLHHFGLCSVLLLQTNRSSQDNKISIRAAKRYMKEIKSVKAEAGCESDLSDDDKGE